MTDREIILDQISRYPKLCETDAVKALYQSVFGCGHLIEKNEAGLKRLKDEISAMGDGRGEDAVEPIGGEYCRAHLRPLARAGLKPETLFALFALSGGKTPGSAARFERAIQTLIEMSGEIGLDADEINREADGLRNLGYSPVSHSPEFRKLYSPAYRVILADYARLIGLFCDIDRLPEPKLIAVDGRCASGKTTLARLLNSVYGLNVFHMDDFFLPRDMRTDERLATPGENVDHKRFLNEVLKLLKSGNEFSYRPYDCSTGKLKPAISVSPGRMAVVEGAYSLHPELSGYYDLKVFMTCGEDERLERILKRNGPEMYKRFVGEWIPMEEAYFAATDIKSRCDRIIDGGEAEI